MFRNYSTPVSNRDKISAKQIPSKRERRSADNFLGVRSVILFVFTAIAFPNLARAQSANSFKFALETKA